MNKVNNLLGSGARTLPSFVVSGIVFLAFHLFNIQVDPTWQTIISIAGGFVYYASLRIFEEYAPESLKHFASVLIGFGYVKQPVYVNSEIKPQVNSAVTVLDAANDELKQTTNGSFLPQSFGD